MSYDQFNNRERAESLKLELEIQRLVDGELDSQQRISLLNLAESQPEVYRSIAIQFIETQSLSHLLSGEPMELVAQGATSKVPGVDSATLAQKKVAPALNEHRLRWLAIAAVLLIGFSFWGGTFFAGEWRIGRGGDDGATIGDANGLSDTVVTTNDSENGSFNLLANPNPISADRVGSGDLASNSSNSDKSIFSGGASDDSELVEPNGNSLDQSQLAFDIAKERSNSRLRLVSELDGNRQSIDLPVVELPSVNRDLLLGNREEAINDLQRELARIGIFMSYESTVIDGSLPDGRRVLVPVRNVNYQPIGY